MDQEALYVALIESRGIDDAFVQTYWARAEDLGAAIEKMLAAARRNGFASPYAAEADPYEVENLRGEVVPSPDAEVFWSVKRYHYPPEHTIQLPPGVIASCTRADDEDPGGITEGYDVSTDEKGLICLGVNVGREELLPLYSSLLQRCAEYKVFWYLLHDHWGETEDAFLVNESLNTPEKIVDHISTHELDSLENGFVTLTAFREEGATNINITDHKRMLIWTYSATVAAAYEQLLEQWEYGKSTELTSIDYRMHHWHYRRPGSRSRGALQEYLRSIGFSDWKPGEKGREKDDI